MLKKPFHNVLIRTTYLLQKSKLVIQTSLLQLAKSLKPAKQTVTEQATCRLVVSFSKIYFCKYYTNCFKLQLYCCLSDLSLFLFEIKYICNIVLKCKSKKTGKISNIISFKYPVGRLMEYG